MNRYFIQLSYNGTAFHGWQIQENTPLTVQYILNEVLSKILGENILTTGCGRTDTGVHALKFFAHFDSFKTDLAENKISWINKFNLVLPHEIAIQDIIKVDSSANSRFDAISRTYHYKIIKNKNPFKINKAYYLYGDLNVEKMNMAALTLFNYSDFSAFSKSNTQTYTNNCKIIKAKWIYDNDELIFVITADRFLRNMVRAIVGTMLDVGRGKIEVENFAQIIESKNRSNAGFSVPACGLYLVDVEYPLNYFSK